MSASLARAYAWPVNVGAYRRSLFSLITPALLPLVAGADIATVAALVAAGASDIGLLVAKEGERGLRAHLRTVITWTGWVLAVALLALAQTEGSGGDMQLGALWVQLDSTDWLLVAGLLAKTVLQTVVPNALPRFGAVLPEQSVADVPEPPRLADGGDLLEPEGVTSLHLALTQEQIDAHLAQARTDALGGPEALPALPAPRVELPDQPGALTVEQVLGEDDPEDDEDDDAAAATAQADVEDDGPEHRADDRAEPDPVPALAGLLSRRRSR